MKIRTRCQLAESLAFFRINSWGLLCLHHNRRLLKDMLIKRHDKVTPNENSMWPDRPRVACQCDYSVQSVNVNEWKSCSNWAFILAVVRPQIEQGDDMTLNCIYVHAVTLLACQNCSCSKMRRILRSIADSETDVDSVMQRLIHYGYLDGGITEMLSHRRLKKSPVKRG